MPDTYNSKYTAAQIESFFDLLNSNSFITNTVSNLVNYYLKTELYTKTEIDTIVTNIKNSRFESVNVLPTENIKTNVIYLLPASNPKTNNIKDEYINIDGTTSGWENIGSTSVDLSNYVTLQALNNALANYVTSSDLTTALENFTPSKEGTDDYSELDNKPSIENVTLDGNKSASDLGLAKSSDLVNKQDKIQVTTMPEASIDLLNKVIQYIGATTQDYIHNYYYECISDGESTPSYSWQQTNVQPSSSSEPNNGGHTIENSEGTDLIQRDTLQFGKGFKTNDDDTNEKTVITPDVMQSGDMDDIVHDLPPVTPIDLDEIVDPVPMPSYAGFANPTGTIIHFMGTIAPDGYLACDGATYNIADYPRLANFFLAQFGAVNNFGGDGTTTFAVPNLQGEFLRGTGSNGHAGEGNGENVGVHQSATSMLMCWDTGSNLQFRALKNANSETSNMDKSQTAAGTIQTITATTSRTDSGSVTHFTARPTNTSVLYCIKD